MCSLAAVTQLLVLLSRAMSSWNFCLSVCFQVLFSIVVFNTYICFRKYYVYGDTEYPFKKCFSGRKRPLGV